MASPTQKQPEGLKAAPASLLSAAESEGKRARGLPPVHLWNPDFCGDIDMRIARDGTWFYMGTPIGRERLVRLFSTILRHDEDGKFYLVTPVEKVGIRVDDAPFLAVSMTVEGKGRDQALTFTTSVGDSATAGPDHPIRFVIDKATGEPAPYVHIRARLEALINRAVFYDLVELGSHEARDGKDWFGVWSGGEFFPFMPAEEMAF
ncbi:MAG: DUF1285 domain-containing protein [Parvibaculum sp.]|uniref:DUF1285 domain-containing protein n=1 Tax=Parvibaculum sp. TaxID=2024848 RepID=UPI0028509094|nr:DUF1285 domain-containing protein [Parvibaculum sp.]MDR3497625.1 DUF1285 domain-containing protein [Parvibaculum sp.]